MTPDQKRDYAIWAGLAVVVIIAVILLVTGVAPQPT
jgi:hypothetical protein